jgi:hypothetical protein
MPLTPARAVVVGLDRLDEALDEILYRPALVRAFRWMPRWWLCDLAKASHRLDRRWGTKHWDASRIVPGEPCAACGRRASIHETDRPGGGTVELCGWCHLDGPILTTDDLDRELKAAAARSIAWRWT